MESIADNMTSQNISIKRKKSKQVFSMRKKKRVQQKFITVEELSKLKEVDGIFHTNLFNMQIEEIMNELKAKQEGKEKLQLWLNTFSDFVKRIPQSSYIPIHEFNLGEAVQIPIHQIPLSNKGSFRFVPPTIVKEIGSFVLNTICSFTPVVDIAVEIPNVCWMSMDFLNHRYHRKRAFYLAYIAHALTGQDMVIDMKFSFQNDCHLKPVLLITPAGIPNFSICLTAYPNEKSFKINRFLISKNNVRSSWLLGTNEDSNQATPYYNSSVLSDLLNPSLNTFLHETISSQNVKNALILLKLWGIQRGLTSSYGRLNGFILTMFVAYLLKEKKVSSLMSSYQIFRCCLLALRNGILTEQPITLCNTVAHGLSLEEFQKFNDVVFIDTSGCFNICWHVTKETALMVKHEAKIGIDILDKETPDGFNHLFMEKISFNKKFEYLLHLEGAKKFKKYVKKLKMEDAILDFGNNVIPVIVPKICSLLQKGLNKRITLIDTLKLSHTPWPINEAPPDPNTGQVTFGFLLNPDVPLNNLEKGPLADDLEAKIFRDFWGDKSELRRFQDGTIREAVFWPAETTSQKRKVFSFIVNDILKRHLTTDSNIVQTGTEIDCILEMQDYLLSSDFPPYGTGEETFETLLRSFNSLCKQMRAIKGLPLLISSIQGISPAFRFSEVFPPIPISHKIDKNCYVDGKVLKLKELAGSVPSYTSALKVIVNLEGSGKWPDDIEAIKRVKAAFHLKIAQLIQAQYSLISVPFITHADIYKDGFLFRIQVASHKEIFLMKQAKTEKGARKIHETKESLDLEMSVEILPKMNSVLHGLHQQHNSYGTACRLAKRWVSSQLKQVFLQDITVELLVAHLYIHPEPYTSPSLPQVAFIRFLTLLLTHDWVSLPLIVNLNNEFKTEEIEEIYSTFTSQRSTLPAMVIATPFDKRGSMWTKNMPPALILKRIAILAEASLKAFEEILNNTRVIDIKSIFRPPLEKFDVLIYLKRDQIPRLTNSIDIHSSDSLPQYELYKADINESFPVIAFDPIQKYLDELRENFSEFAFFLYDIYGGDCIAVVWKKSIFTPQDYTVSHVERLLEDFFVFGRGIVKNVVKQTQNWQLP